MEDALNDLLRKLSKERFTESPVRRSAITEDEARKATAEHVRIARAIAAASDKLIAVYHVDLPELIGFVEIEIDSLCVNGLLFEKRRNNVYRAHAFGVMTTVVQYDEFHRHIMQVYDTLTDEEKQHDWS